MASSDPAVALEVPEEVEVDARTGLTPRFSCATALVPEAGPPPTRRKGTSAAPAGRRYRCLAAYTVRTEADMQSDPCPPRWPRPGAAGTPPRRR